MFFDEIFLDKGFDESYFHLYDRMMNVASRVFTDDSVDDARKKDLFCCFIVLMVNWMILNKKKKIHRCII